MNSPNFGNQQILLQSCCFFDSERSQTPHASNTIIKDFALKQENKPSSPIVPHMDEYLKIDMTKKRSNKLIPSKDKKRSFTEQNTSNIKKLKSDNKALKLTIKNLTSQLDRVCIIAEKAKNNELNTIQLKKNNEEEKNDLMNKIDYLTKEKEELKKEMKKKEEEYNNYKMNTKIEEMNNKNKIIDNEKKHRKFVSELSNEFENIKQMNNSLSITVNKEINDNKKYKLIINKLNRENEQIKKKS
jgi:exonuclease SbcC